METKRPLYIFIISFCLISLLRVVSKEFQFLGPGIFTVLFLILLVICIFATPKLLTDYPIENNYARRLFQIFFFYVLFIIIRGLSFDIGTVRELLLSEFTFWVYIVPIFLFFDKKLITFVHMINAIHYMGIFFLVVCALHPSFITTRANAEFFVHPFAFTSGFILLNARYLSKAKKVIAFLAMLVGVASYTYLARRNGIVSFAGLILASFALNAKNLSASKIVKIFPAFAGVIILALLATDTIPSALTKKLNDRLTEDSRSYVFDYLFAGMEDNMALGKGMNGTYYCPMGGGGPNEDGVESTLVEYRDVIENGYLQLYLNGGIIYIILFLLMLLPAALLGIFRSENQFVQACGIIVFLWLIDMSIFGLPRLILQYVLVWICAGVCYTQRLRETPDEEIADLFKNYKDNENTVVH